MSFDFYKEVDATLANLGRLYREADERHADAADRRVLIAERLGRPLEDVQELDRILGHLVWNLITTGGDLRQNAQKSKEHV